MKSNQKNNHNSGFSLIELILYTALVGMFVTSIVSFAWQLLGSRTKSMVQQEVNQNGRMVLKRLEYEIKNAQIINSSSSQELCLASSDPNYNPTRFYLNAGQLRIAWGGGSANCTSMTHDEVLTSDQISVSALTFSNLSVSTTSANIGYQFTLGSTADRVEWQYQQDFSGATEVRSIW